MPIQLRQFLADRDLSLVTIQRTKLVREALKQMIDNNYTLLPVVDDGGELTGVISEQSITRAYYHTEGATPLLELTVEHCQEPAETLTMGDSLTQAIRKLRDTYAVIIVDGKKPQAIITDYDTNHFFQHYSEDLIRVERIEQKLRAWVEAIFPDEKDRREAAKRATEGQPRIHRQKGPKSDWLTFAQYIRIVDYEEHWPRFAKAFEARDLFYYLIDQVREIRNQLAHFDQRPNASQRDLLLRAAHWMEQRPWPTELENRQ
jgi:hypothetical protein